MRTLRLKKMVGSQRLQGSLWSWKYFDFLRGQFWNIPVWQMNKIIGKVKVIQVLIQSILVIKSVKKNWLYLYFCRYLCIIIIFPVYLGFRNANRSTILTTERLFGLQDRLNESEWEMRIVYSNKVYDWTWMFRWTLPKGSWKSTGNRTFRWFSCLCLWGNVL